MYSENSKTYLGLHNFKVACTSCPIFEKNIKRYPILSVQIIYYQIDQMHKWKYNWFNFILTASKMEFSYFLYMA